MLANGKTIYNTVKEKKPGRMAVCITVNTLKERKVDKESICMQMEVCTTACGPPMK